MIDATTRQEKIKRFLSDSVMNEVVRDVLTTSFLKHKDRTDIHLLAASRIAIDLLEDGWKELEKHKNASKSEKKPLEQVGL